MIYNFCPFFTNPRIFCEFDTNRTELNCQITKEEVTDSSTITEKQSRKTKRSSYLLLYNSGSKQSLVLKTIQCSRKFDSYQRRRYTNQKLSVRKLYVFLQERKNNAKSLFFLEGRASLLIKTSFKIY